MEYALIGGAFVLLYVLVGLAWPSSRLERWRRSMDTTPEDLRRSDDGRTDGDEHGPSTTWMFPPG